MFLSLVWRRVLISWKRYENNKVLEEISRLTSKRIASLNKMREAIEDSPTWPKCKSSICKMVSETAKSKKSIFFLSVAKSHFGRLRFGRFAFPVKKKNTNCFLIEYLIEENQLKFLYSWSFVFKAWTWTYHEPNVNVFTIHSKKLLCYGSNVLVRPTFLTVCMNVPWPFY